jgi:6-phosphogluconolactonase
VSKPQTAQRTFVREFGKLARNTKDTFTCALTGGSSALALYPLLAHEEIDWSRVKLFLSDERCVPSDHADSNFRQLKKALPMARIQRVRTELPPADAAADYARGLPEVLDLVHLGMGEDGHVASLFPGHALLKEERLRVASLTDSPKPPPERVTFTLPTLRKAKAIWFLVLGEAKREVANTVRNDPACQLPAALVHRSARTSTWFTDF